MNDHELLLLAAKAIKFTPAVNKFGEDRWSDGGSGCFRWNPILDDEDALRLAVKLNMHVDIDSEATTVFIHPAGKIVHVSEPHNGESYAATRRAIVMAAAELGGRMKWP